MNKLFGWAIFYAGAALALSCADIGYAWYAPVYDAAYKTNINWFASAGLFSGTLGYHKYDTGIDLGWQYSLHAPHFPDLAIHAGGGLEGGSAFIAAWLFAIGAYIVHLFWLAGAGKLRGSRARR